MANQKKKNVVPNKGQLPRLGLFNGDVGVGKMKNSPVLKAAQAQIKDTFDVMKQMAGGKLKPVKKKNWWEKVADAAVSVAGDVVSKIPVVNKVAPVAKKLLSTLNDDEWFSEFKAAGATFNELLGDKKLSADKQNRDMTGCLINFKIKIFDDMGSTPTPWQDSILPTLLAYVRTKTNNVLVATEAEYYDAFKAGVQLYALYYFCEKLVELNNHLPINISNIAEVIDLIKPANFSVLVGIRDSLRAYLQTTVRLPHALVMYLRWRFGTTFLSENTGKSGLVQYMPDCTQYAAVTIADYSTTRLAAEVSALKARVAVASRAMADFREAFSDHDIKYDVEPRHYDEKEFNLRCNMRVDKNTASAGTTNSVNTSNTLVGLTIYMDSRLDSNAAFQAITLSTDGADNYAPFRCIGGTLHWYQVENVTFPYYNDVTSAATSTVITAGWKTVDIWNCLTQKMVACHLTTNAAPYKYAFKAYIKDYLNTDPAAFNGAGVTGSLADALNAAWNTYVGGVILNSLQVHGQSYKDMLYQDGTSVVFTKPYVGIKGKPLSYDEAIVTPEQISATHRIAIRNLIRGNYKRKLEVSSPSIVKLEEAVLEDVIP